MECTVNTSVFQLSREEEMVVKFVREASIDKLEKFRAEISKINGISEFKKSFENCLNLRKNLEFAAV